MRVGTGLFLCIGLVGCRHSDSSDDTASADDSSSTDDSASGDDSGTLCTLVVADTSPRKGGGPWLYSDPLRVTFNEPAKAATFALRDAEGNPVAFTPTWGKGATDVSLDADLTGSATYTFDVTACGTTTSIDFTTSVYGSPLAIDPKALVGQTYVFDLATAEYEQPAGLGALVALYVSAQVLLGVTAADATTLALLGGQGGIDDFGVFAQDTSISTFELAGVDFSNAPFFRAQADQVAIVVEETYTLYDFSAEGTFAPDGESIGGATLSMLVDTTNLGDAMNLPNGNDPMAVCDYIEPLGIPCTDCPGGAMKRNCLPIIASWDEAPRVPGLTLDVVVAKE